MIYDIAIVGGGVQGLFFAYYAKKKYPNKSVVLFECKAIGSGITAYSGHLHIPYGTGDKKELTRESILLYKELMNQFDDFPIDERDFVGVYKHENHESIFEDLILYNPLNTSGNYSYKELNAEYLVISGMKGWATRRTLANYLFELVSQKGVVIYEGTKVDSTHRENDCYLINTNAGYQYKSTALINASGASIQNLEGLNNYKIRTKKTVAFHINKQPAKGEPITYFFDDGAFLLPQPYYSRYLFSYTCDEWDMNIDSNSLVIKTKNIKNAQDILDTYTNDFSDYILGAQVYLDLYNDPSSSPIIQEVEENYIIIGATGGSGVRLAPALAVNALNNIKLQ